jgi:acylphosphatase
MSGARFLVSGKVQGVWFRASAREQALALHLVGFARNLRDGSVEVVAQGEDAALAALEAWLHQGPPMADVAEVQREELASSLTFTGFSTL